MEGGRKRERQTETDRQTETETETETESVVCTLHISAIDALVAS